MFVEGSTTEGWGTLVGDAEERELHDTFGVGVNGTGLRTFLATQ